MNPSNSNHAISPVRFDAGYLAGTAEAIFRCPVADVAFAPLLGDASTRQYFRVTFRKTAGKNGKETLIVMQLEKPVKGTETDFILTLKFLEGLDLPVPRLFHYDAENGLLFLEDCGDTTFEEKVRSAQPDEIGAYYRQAVALLVKLQSEATKQVGPRCPAYHLRFDVEKLMWEFDFMLEHYAASLHGARLSGEAAREVRRHFQPLCETLAGQELYFTHRDYHSRNLMVHNGRLVMLDFQDARMGPCQYDLASLLRDSYVGLEDSLVEEMKELYIELKESAESRPVDRKNFYEIFDLMSIQRNLKAVGTFAHQSVARKNGRYLEYIPRTLGYVRRTLNGNPGLAPLRLCLETHIPGLRDSGQ
ncbi:MAG: phosphotransferase [Nitrospinae bacterium]|nr:phosphotransferase [Nitrospinota bacterium]